MTTRCRESSRQYDRWRRVPALRRERRYITVDVAIAKYEKLAQIQTGFIYDDTGDVHELVKPTDNPRLNLLKQLLEEEIEGKCCVVYRHRPVFELLLKALAKYNPRLDQGRA